MLSGWHSKDPVGLVLLGCAARHEPEMYQWNWYFKPYFEFVHQFLRALAGSECRETLNKFVFSVFLKPECSALKQTWTPTESVYWSVWMQSLCTSGKLCRESSISICRHSELTCCSLARNACFGFHSFDVTFAAMLHLNVALPSGKRKVLEVAVVLQSRGPKISCPAAIPARLLKTSSLLRAMSCLILRNLCTLHLGLVARIIF